MHSGLRGDGIITTPPGPLGADAVSRVPMPPALIPGPSRARRVAALGAAVVASAVFAAFAPVAWSQTPSQPPAAKPKPAPAVAAPAKKADEKTLSLGGGGATAAQAEGAQRRGLLDREELRACLKEEAAIRTRLEQAEAQRKQLNDEKNAIEAERATLKTEREALEARQKSAAEDLQTRFKAYGARVEAWNKKVAEFNDSPKSGSAGDRARKAIEDERAQLDKDRVALEADKNTVAARVTDEVKTYNDRANAAQAKAEDWNRRNRDANEANQLLEGERKTWVQTCSNRRYREEDEQAIKAGK